MAKKSKLSTVNKISIAITVLMVLILIFVFSRTATKPPKSIEGKVDVNLNVSNSEIDKGSTLDDVEIKSEVIDSIYEDDKKDRISEAKTGETSYIESLDLDNGKLMQEDLNTEAKQISNQESIDAILAIDSRIEANREKERIKNKEKRLQAQTNPAPSKQVNPPPKPEVLFDKDAFLKGELGLISQRAKENKTIEKISSRITEDVTKPITASSKSNGKNNRSMTNRLSNSGRYKEIADKNLANQNSKLNQYRADNGGVSTNTNKKKSTYSQSIDPANIIDEELSTYIPSATIKYAILEIGVNTDEISPIRATIIQEGPLKGAKFLGTPARVGNKAVLAFESLTINNKDYPVKAVALDVETMRTAIADRVNHHTLERYGKLMIASFLSGYANSLVDSKSSTGITGEKTTETSAIPDPDDQVKYAVGKMGEKFVPYFERQFERQPTVEIDPNKEIAILFLNGVEIK